MDERGGGGGDGPEVVSRESPVVIVVIKWRLAGGLASPLFAFGEVWKETRNERDREG